MLSDKELAQLLNQADPAANYHNLTTSQKTPRGRFRHRIIERAKMLSTADTNSSKKRRRVSATTSAMLAVALVGGGGAVAYGAKLVAGFVGGEKTHIALTCMSPNGHTAIERMLTADPFADCRKGIGVTANRADYIVVGQGKRVAVVHKSLISTRDGNTLIFVEPKTLSGTWTVMENISRDLARFEMIATLDDLRSRSTPSRCVTATEQRQRITAVAQLLERPEPKVVLTATSDAQTPTEQDCTWLVYREQQDQVDIMKSEASERLREPAKVPLLAALTQRFHSNCFALPDAKTVVGEAIEEVGLPDREYLVNDFETHHGECTRLTVEGGAGGLLIRLWGPPTK